MDYRKKVSMKRLHIEHGAYNDDRMVLELFEMLIMKNDMAQHYGETYKGDFVVTPM